MTNEEMQAENKRLLMALKHRNADLRRIKDERAYYKKQALDNERWVKQSDLALKIACTAIPKELLRSGSYVKEPDAMMVLANKQLREKENKK